MVMFIDFFKKIWFLTYKIKKSKDKRQKHRNLTFIVSILNEQIFTILSFKCTFQKTHKKIFDEFSHYKVKDKIVFAATSHFPHFASTATKRLVCGREVRKL